MFKVEIKKDNVVTNQASFDTELEAQAWIDSGVAENWWGLPERWSSEAWLDLVPFDQRFVDLETGEIVEEYSEGLEVEYLYPAEYVVEIHDLTAQASQEKTNEEALKYLADTDWYVIRAMDTGVACPEEIKILRQQARDAIVK